VRPKIAVLMDENTSSGGTRYEAHKGAFHKLLAGGGAPYGVPYAPELVEAATIEFDGLLALGGRFAYPPDWYIDGNTAKSPASDRLAFEGRLMASFLAAKKPILGICAGMQTLACLNGSKLIADSLVGRPGALAHDAPDRLHIVSIYAGTLLRRVVQVENMQVNTFHREAIVEPGAGVTVSARAEDAIVEAVELDHHRFAMGIQWHQELVSGFNHPAEKIFPAFVQACRKS
jgi:putative glutamine amidotransferase